MGFATDDRRIPDSFSIAEKQGLEYHFTANETEEVDHPNTVDIIMTNEEGQTLTSAENPWEAENSYQPHQPGSRGILPGNTALPL